MFNKVIGFLEDMATDDEVNDFYKDQYTKQGKLIDYEEYIKNQNEEAQRSQDEEAERSQEDQEDQEDQ